jgi:hypothetical protein
MPKRGKDKKKKRRQKGSVSKAEGDTNLLVGKQGLNVPRPISLPIETAIPHTRRHLPFANDEAFPDLSNGLPNLDVTSSHQAEADERDWQFLAIDLMGDNGDDLMTSSSQPSTGDTSAVVAEEAVDPGRMTVPTGIQRQHAQTSRRKKTALKTPIVKLTMMTTPVTSVCDCQHKR